MPKDAPLEILCNKAVTLPTFIIVSSIFSLVFGSEEGVKGASPIPGNVNSINWPVLNSNGSFGLKTKVLIVELSVIISKTSASMGLYIFFMVVVRQG